MAFPCASILRALHFCKTSYILSGTGWTSVSLSLHSGRLPGALANVSPEKRVEMSELRRTDLSQEAGGLPVEGLAHMSDPQSL